MRTSTVKFAKLRQLLLDLGFREAGNAEARVFQRVLSDTLFLFRPYRAGDYVTEYNLASVQEMLDQRGLMEAATFVDRLKQTPA